MWLRTALTAGRWYSDNLVKLCNDCAKNSMDVFLKFLFRSIKQSMQVLCAKVRKELEFKC